MPFQSEKQRRYLWANEPEIARDWTDTYGSRISKLYGGIMHPDARRGFPGGLDYFIRSNADVSRRISDALKQSGNPIASGVYDIFSAFGSPPWSLFHFANSLSDIALKLAIKDKPEANPILPPKALAMPLP